MRSDYLSKSLYLRGLQCPKALFLCKSGVERKLSEAAKARLAAGTDVGLLARDLFPWGTEIPYQGVPIREQLARTKALIDGGATVLYEPAFSHAGVFVKVDILRKVKSQWNIYEVKSTTEVKDVHIQDGAIQAHVVRGAGLPVSKTHIIHIDNSYVRKGEIEPGRLFSVADITEDISGTDGQIRDNIESMKEVLQSRQTPDVLIGKQCSNPYECDFEHVCWPDRPVDSVLHLRGRRADRFALYHAGIRFMKDIPVDCLDDKQRFQVEATVGRKTIVDRNGVRVFLSKIRYPLCYLDFETCMSAVPLFDGTRPYQQIPFQFSLHIRQRAGAPLRHEQFLARPNGDPREEFLQQLLRLIPPGSCILTYNQAFEGTRLRELKESFPKHADAIDGLLNNMVDLMIPFKQRTVYHWRMKGSYSIKEVLPALVPDLSYDDLEISDGGMAMDAYLAMRRAADPAQVERTRTALLKYCKRDTEAMVKILEKLEEMG